MPVRKFRFLSVIIGIADPLSSPHGLGVSPHGVPTMFSSSGSRRRWRLDATQRNRRLSPAMQFGRPRNALGQARVARDQSAYPGLR